MRSHRVWNTVNARNYAKPYSKSFGGEFSQHIAVGSSSRHSNDFASIEVRERDLHGDWTVFTLSVDGETVKRAVFNNRTKEFAPLPLSVPADALIEQIRAARS